MPPKGAYYLGSQTTYGQGYCGICGETKAPPLVPRLAKWWDPDDGWRVGVLCSYCFGDAERRPPREGDFAYRRSEQQSQTIDTLHHVLGDDIDGLLAELEDITG